MSRSDLQVEFGSDGARANKPAESAGLAIQSFDPLDSVQPGRVAAGMQGRRKTPPRASADRA